MSDYNSLPIPQNGYIGSPINYCPPEWSDVDRYKDERQRRREAQYDSYGDYLYDNM